MFEIQHARTNGFLMGFIDTGQPTRPAVLLSHSHFSDYSMWSPQIDALRQHYRVIAYDTRGHGSSESPEGGYTLEELADDVRQLIAHLNLNKVHFVGLSLGGMIGMTFALGSPERLHSLLLCDTAAEMPESVWTDRIATARVEGLMPLVAPTMTRWFTEDFRNRAPDTVAEMSAVAARTTLAGYLGCAEAIRAMRLAEKIKAIDLPTRVIVGAEDPATPVSAATQISEAIDRADLVVIEDAAHLSNLEQPETFTAAMLEFLTDSSVEGGAR